MPRKRSFATGLSAARRHQHVPKRQAAVLALKVSAERNGDLVGLDDSSWPPWRWYL